MSTLLDALIRSQVGPGARHRIYDRDLNSVMNLTLDHAERRLGTPFNVVWVDNGPAEMFVLPQTSPAHVVYCTRAVVMLAEFVAVVQGQSTFSGEDEDLVDISRRFFLEVVAKRALRRGRTTLAVHAMAASQLGRRSRSGVIQLSDLQPRRIEDLESDEITERYMTDWFFGLFHELGHLPRDQGPIGVDQVRAAVEQVGRQVGYSDRALERVVDGGLDNNGEVVQPLDLQAIGIEMASDLFATEQLFQATLDIMNEYGERAFDGIAYAVEALIALNAVVFLDRCTRVAAHASGDVVDRDLLLLPAYNLLEMGSRAAIQQAYLSAAVGTLYFPDLPNEEAWEKGGDLIQRVVAQLDPRFDQIDEGMRIGREYISFERRGVSDWSVVERLRVDLQEMDDFEQLAVRTKLMEFMEMADDYGVADDRIVRALDTLTGASPGPVVGTDLRAEDLEKAGGAVDLSGDQIVGTVPWLEVESEYDGPYFVPDGNVLNAFVFWQSGTVLDEFMAVSQEIVDEGAFGDVANLSVAGVVAETEDALVEEVLRRLPSGGSGKVLVEGTAEFDAFFGVE